MTISATVRREVKDRNGLVPLGKVIGRGGEGSVFGVVNRPDVVAKIYHRPAAAEKAAKIEAMAGMATEGLLAFTAWPLELLRTPNDVPCGLLMPRISGHKDVHKLYSPRSRKIEFPRADWRFLVRAAANTARSFAAIHEAGCVIGDVNHGGVTVSENATVKLIDCDSFQVVAAGRQFLCEVGVPTFTPPELQGKAFRGVVRTSNHDNFGLAVLIFHLLFIGRHPFAGRFRGSGEMGIPRAITEHRFAYGRDGSASQMEPPPNVPSLTIAARPIPMLFERAFSREATKGGRPTAIEWISALGQLEGQLKKCRSNISHYYLNTLDLCPWCSIERGTGAFIFVTTPRYYGISSENFDIDTVWADIVAVEALKSPGNPVDEKAIRNVFLRKSKPKNKLLKIDWVRDLLIVLILVTAFGLCFVFPFASPFLLAATFFLSWKIYKQTKNQKSPRELAEENLRARTKYKDTMMKWAVKAGSADFDKERKKLEKLKDELSAIPNLYQEKLRALRLDIQVRQKKRFLEQVMIDEAHIPGVGLDLKAMLESYDVETAWDITRESMRAVPGVGRLATEDLLRWRRSVESKFRFNPRQGVDPWDVAVLNREISDLRQHLERRLSDGPKRLVQVREQIVSRRANLRRQAEQAFREMLQTEADMRAAGA